MHERHIIDIAAWLVEQGLAGTSEPDLLTGFCTRCCSAGLQLSRVTTFIDTLHPVYEGRAFRWRNDGIAEDHTIEYGRTTEGEAAESWRRSVFYYLLTTGGDEFRRRLTTEDVGGFTQLEAMRADGHTDHFALVHRFARSIGEMDCVYSSWNTKAERGFDEAGLAALRRLVPSLALAIKSASLTRIASTLVEVYLGRDAGRRVLKGRIARGTADRLEAVLWFSDLRGYTGITDRAAPDEIIPLLNDYADAVISAILEAGGDVLKLIGDGVLAIFKAKVPAQACAAALAAEADLRRRLVGLEARRINEGRPVTTVYLGLHIGDVFYGNIGSQTRLDFTVVGPAVNEVGRIASLCRAADRNMLMSAAFAAAAPPEARARFASVGRYALRGVARAQELFTVDIA
jgi:adenylate cyclase